MKRILIQKNDFKSKGWAKAAKELGLGELIPIPGSPMYMPLFLLKYILVGNKPDAIVFRYLNDYKSLARSLLRTLTDTSTVAIAKLLNVKIFWLCHNVDKESSVNFEHLSTFRRNLLLRYSERILVTDKLLEKAALKFLRKSNNNIKSLCFGPISYVDNEWDIVGSDILVINEEIAKFSKNKVRVGLLIGSDSPKNLIGLKWIANYITNDEYCAVTRLNFVVIGDVCKMLKRDHFEIYDSLTKSDHVLIIDQNVNYPVIEWNKSFTFVLNPLPDYSVAYTVYNCALAKLPILTVDSPFLGDFVEYYKIGMSINWHDNSTKLESFFSCDSYQFAAFLDSHTWFHGAKVLFKDY